MFYQITLVDRGALALAEKLFVLPQVKDVTRIWLSLQCKAGKIPDRFFYVPGDWRCRFFFRVEATNMPLLEEWLSVEVRICPATLLNHVRQIHAPLIFTPTFPMTESWLSHLHAITVDAMERLRVILGYFMLEQIVSKVSQRTLVSPSHGP